ncbi:MAG: hypothetical protein JKY50_22645 [Oleispira sp.]|nr:hypothetical protein [Oleispira sp.]
MLKKIELIRQVLASATRAKLPRAEEAMNVLAEINEFASELKGFHEEIKQDEQDEQEDGRNG